MLSIMWLAYKYGSFNGLLDNEDWTPTAGFGAVVCRDGSVKKTLLDETKYPDARCIDGSRPAYYVRKGHGDGENKWVVHFEGGGWCYDYAQCADRKRLLVGSSRTYPACIEPDHMRFYMSPSEAANPMMHNWNTVHVRYCDGSSYAGDATVVHEGEVLYFRGRANRDSTILSLLTEHGMATASEVVISGCSAGALGVYLGLDHMAALVKAANPATRVRGLADSGFFLDHTGDSTYSKPRVGMTKFEALIDGVLDYAGTMRRVYAFMNVTAGANKRCVLKERAVAGDSSNCMFAPYLAPHVRTPLFAVQPKFDQWQLWHVVGKPFNFSVVNRYGARLQGLLEARLLRNQQHGAFVDGCTHHCTSCSAPGEDSWNGQHVKSTAEQITPAEAFRRWYGRSLGGSSGGGSGSRSATTATAATTPTENESDRSRAVAAPERAAEAEGRSGNSASRRGRGIKHRALVAEGADEQADAAGTMSSREGRIFIQVAEYPCQSCCICRP